MSTKSEIPAIAPAYDEVDKLLIRAGTACGTVFSLCRDAAMIAAKDLPKTGTFDSRVKYVLAKHSVALAEAKKLGGHEITQYFTNALWLWCAPDSKIEVKSATKNQGTVLQPASEVIGKLSRNKLAEESKILRDSVGAGNSKKTGRKPNPIEIDLSARGFFAQLPLVVRSPEHCENLQDALAMLGWILTRASAKQMAQRADPIGQIVRQVIRQDASDTASV